MTLQMRSEKMAPLLELEEKIAEDFAGTQVPRVTSLPKILNQPLIFPEFLLNSSTPFDQLPPLKALKTDSL